MKKIVMGFLLIIANNLYSSELVCKILNNQEAVFDVEVSTILDQKVLIDSGDGIYAYITEKKENYFVLEAFLADFEMRIFGEGTIKDQNDRIVLSSWSRASLIELECRLSPIVFTELY